MTTDLRSRKAFRQSLYAWPLAYRKRIADLIEDATPLKFQMLFAKRGSGGRHLRQLVWLYPAQRGMRPAYSRLLSRIEQ